MISDIDDLFLSPFCTIEYIIYLFIIKDKQAIQQRKV